jgi:hypothetical protein
LASLLWPVLWAVEPAPGSPLLVEKRRSYRAFSPPMRELDILLQLEIPKVSETTTSLSVLLTEHLLQKSLEHLYHVFVEVDA